MTELTISLQASGDDAVTQLNALTKVLKAAFAPEEAPSPKEYPINVFSLAEAGVRKHPNADSLSVADFDGFQCVINTAQWEGVEKAAYLPPESVVDTTRPEFAFLALEAKADGTYKIKARRLRGELSFGLLVPAKPGWEVGQDVSKELGVTHWNPPEIKEGSVKVKAGDKILEFFNGNNTKNPPIYVPVYDLENGRKYGKKVWTSETLVQVSEKIHGCLHINTPVLMADGSKKPISQIEPGEKILSFNLEKGVFEPDEVVDRMIRPPSDMVEWLDIKLENGETVTVTACHKFLTTEGWVEAGKLTEEHDIVSIF